jgi:hypothetical protein
MIRLVPRRLSLLMAAPFLLATLAYSQTPAPNVPVLDTKSDKINLKGCVGGTDPDYTIAEDQTGRVVKITPSGVDLKVHLGHDVKLAGHNAGGAPTSGPAANGFIASELTMIAGHCAASTPTAAVLSTAVTPDTPAPSTPSPTTAAPDNAPAASASTPSAPGVAAAAPAATVTTTTETVTARPTFPDGPAVAVAPPFVATPAATTSTTSETVTTPVAVVATPASPAESKATVSTITDKTTTSMAAAHPTKHSGELRKQKAAVAEEAAAAPNASTETTATPGAISTDPASTTGIPATPPPAPAVSSSATPTPGAAIIPAPAPSSGFPLWLAVVILVLALGLGALKPLLNKWRTRQLPGEPSTQSLSLTLDPDTNPNKADFPKPRKAA